MGNKKPNFILFGASGDLSRRYLLPALKNIQDLGLIGEIVPISRKDYSRLRELITGGGEKIFNLAIPPEAVTDVVQMIADNFKGDNLKIMLEKPFGQDLQSARDLINHIDQYFKESQIYRVDHYLVKRSLQSVVEERWSRENISSVDIVASEEIGIEDRVSFYEQIGALKDFAQSHLLEMAAVVLSGSFEVGKRYEALKNLEIILSASGNKCLRGQYEGYREEVNNPESVTETFVSINVISNDSVWRGIPITLTTGKALSKKETQIIIKYKDGSRKIFNIEHEPDSYERVIEAAVKGERDLFISSGEILESWRILDPVQKKWRESSKDLIIYKKGSTPGEVINI